MVLHPLVSLVKYDFVKEEVLDIRPYPHDNTDTFISKYPELEKADYWFWDTIVMLFPFKEVSTAGPAPVLRPLF